MKTMRLVALALLGMTLGGCSSSSPTPQLDDLPTVTKYPYHAGIYYSPGFRSAKHYDKYQGSGGHTTELGAASVLMLDEIFPRVFEKTSALNSLTAEEARRKGVDLIVVPSLESFQLHRELDRGRNVAPLHMSYRFTLWSKDGVAGPSWTVHSGSQGTGAPKVFVTEGMVAADVMEQAARRIVARLEWESSAISQVATGIAARNLAPAPQVRISAASTGLMYPAGGRSILLPMLVRVDSQDDRALLVRPSDMRLKLAAGQVLEPLSSSEVLSVMELNRSMRAAQNESELMLLTTLLNLGNPVASSPTQASMADQEAARREFARDRRSILEQLVAQVLKPTAMVKGTARSGLVYFRLPPNSTERGAMLSGWVVEAKTAASAAFDVPFNSDLGEQRP